MSGHDVKTAEIVILKDGEAVAQHMAHWLLELALAKKDGPFVIALSGGTTPKRLFQILAEPRISDRFPWGNTEIFYGDERYVPAGDPASNYTMSREALLDHVSMPQANVHPIPTDATPDADAARYQKELETVRRFGTPARQTAFRCGDAGDGTGWAHGFPVSAPAGLEGTGQVGLDLHARQCAAYAPDPDLPGHSLQQACRVSAGGGRQGGNACAGSQGEDALPSCHITSEGDVTFLVDEAAAGNL